jgi:hypothetical protein
MVPPELTPNSAYDQAIELANQSPCDPRTLIRAARDMVEKEPLFAL